MADNLKVQVELEWANKAGFLQEANAIAQQVEQRLSQAARVGGGSAAPSAGGGRVMSAGAASSVFGIPESSFTGPVPSQSPAAMLNDHMKAREEVKKFSSPVGPPSLPRKPDMGSYDPKAQWLSTGNAPSLPRKPDMGSYDPKASWTSTGNAPPMAGSMRMNDHEWTASGRKAGDAAGKTFGLHAAWILRAATSGGPLGVAGGALGAGIGALAGGLTGGALLGNFAAQMAGGGVSHVRGLVGKANPTSATRFDRATADFQAVLGRDLAPALDNFTAGIRMAADLLAGGKGKSMHAAVASGAGAHFGSLDDVYRSIVSETVMQNIGPAYPKIGPNTPRNKFMQQYSTFGGVQESDAGPSSPPLGSQPLFPMPSWWPGSGGAMLDRMTEMGLESKVVM